MDIAGDVKRWFVTSNFDGNDERPLWIGENEKVTSLFKGELGGKIIIEVVALRPKTWSYLMDDGSEHKKTKGIKKAAIKNRIMFENFKGCLFNNKIIWKLQQTFKNYLHNVYTIEVNKTALSSNDNKRLQTFDRVTSFPHGTNAFKLYKNEMRDVCKAKETLSSKDCENDMYVTCNIFLKYMGTKCKSAMKKVCEN